MHILDLQLSDGRLRPSAGSCLELPKDTLFFLPSCLFTDCSLHLECSLCAWQCTASPSRFNPNIIWSLKPLLKSPNRVNALCSLHSVFYSVLHQTHCCNKLSSHSPLSLADEPSKPLKGKEFVTLICCLSSCHTSQHMEMFSPGGLFIITFTTILSVLAFYRAYLRKAFFFYTEQSCNY